MGTFVNILKRFFVIKKSENSKFIFNFLLFLAITIFVFTPDVFLAITHRATFVINQPIITAIILGCFFLAFSGKIAILLFLLFVLIIQIMNVGYLCYSGMQIGPTEIVLAFEEVGDIKDSISQYLFLTPIFFIPFALILFLIIKFKNRMIFSPLCFVIFICAIIFVFYNANKKTFAKAQAYPVRLTIHNSLNTFPYVIVKGGKFERVKIPESAIINYKIEKNNQETPRIILLFLGETISWADLKILNEKLDRNTTPNIEKIFNIDNNKHWLKMRAIGSGICTTSAHHLFYNLINTPTDINKITVSKKQNIYELAKQNGYKTHYLANQPNKYLEISGSNPEDVIVNESIAHIKSFQTIRDDHLIELFKKLDLSQGKHFVVGYHNCLLYWDDLMSQLFEMAKEKGADYIFFTPDHGEMVSNLDGTICSDKKCKFGHCFMDERVVRIPFLAYSKDENNFIKMKEYFTQNQITSHYEISKFIAELFGYKIENPKECKNEFYVHDGRALANYKVIKTIREGDKINVVFRGTINELYEKKMNECGAIDKLEPQKDFNN